MWQGIGAQLRNPSGRWGRMAGSVMAFANAKPNTLAVAALGMRDGESLLELGCGPGCALQDLLRLPHVARVIGLDWSEVMLAQSRRAAIGWRSDLDVSLWSEAILLGFLCAEESPMPSWR